MGDHVELNSQHTSIPTPTTSQRSHDTTKSLGSRHQQARAAFF